MAEPPQQRSNHNPKLPPRPGPFLVLRIMCLFLALSALIGPSAWAETGKPALPSPASPANEDSNQPISIDQFKDEIQKFIGIPYRRGGAGFKGMDCSGLIKRIYAKLFGIDLPHNSSQQSRLPFLKTVSAKDLKTGDLIFFGPKGRRINHVGVYLAEGKFMHAGRRSGVTIASLNTNYWKSRFIVSKRIEGLELTEDNGEDLQPYALAHSLGLDRGTSGGQTRMLELGYQANFWENILQFNTGAFVTASFEEDDQPGLSDRFWTIADGFSDKSEQMDYRPGFHMTSILRPLDWMWIMPSWSYIHGQDIENTSDNGREWIGLNTGMRIPESSWSLSLATRTARQSDPSQWLLGSSPPWDFRDISIGLHFRPSDDLHLSVSARREWHTSDDFQNNTLNKDTPSDDLHLQLDFSF